MSRSSPRIVHVSIALGLALGAFGCAATPSAQMDASTTEAGADAGLVVRTCEDAIASVRGIPCWTECPTTIACDLATSCALPGCPVTTVSCRGGRLNIYVSGVMCDTGPPSLDAGPRPDSAIPDAGARFDAWTDCGWPDGENTCLCDGVSACDAVAGGMWAPLGSSAMRTCARRGDTCDVAYFTETEGGAAGYHCSIAVGTCGLDLARDCQQVVSCNLLMGDCPAEIVPTNVIPCELAFPPAADAGP
jgi:hypothetical protein